VTTWPIPQNSRKETKSGCTSLPGSEESPKLQLSWEGRFKITWINDVVYQIQQHPRVKMMVVVHLDRLAPYLGATWNKQP
jgi:hypothetical protein